MTSEPNFSAISLAIFSPHSDASLKSVGQRIFWKGNMVRPPVVYPHPRGRNDWFPAVTQSIQRFARHGLLCGFRWTLRKDFPLSQGGGPFPGRLDARKGQGPGHRLRHRAVLRSAGRDRSANPGHRPGSGDDRRGGTSSSRGEFRSWAWRKSACCPKAVSRVFSASATSCPTCPAHRLAEFLVDVYRLLAPGGIWIFQTVNFDPIMNESDMFSRRSTCLPGN